MSLKAFHIVFVVMSILLTLFCGVLLVWQYASTRETALLAPGIVSLACCGGLVCYGKSVLRKLKHISYL
jgi:hypothetical protein